MSAAVFLHVWVLRSMELPQIATILRDVVRMYSCLHYTFGSFGMVCDRYQCFADQKEFEQQVQKKQPHKIDIGAVFTLPPKARAPVVGFFCRPRLEHAVHVSRVPSLRRMFCFCCGSTKFGSLCGVCFFL